MIERIFHLRGAGTTLRIELLGGLTTFLTMAYIIFVNSQVLSTDFVGNPTGLSVEAVMLATCVSAFIATFIMGLYANYPIAQAPGMGENFFFITVVMALAARGITNAWQVALGIVFISGVAFLILSLARFRHIIIDSVSPSLKNGIAVGIGLFIAFIGLHNAGVIIPAAGTMVKFKADLKDINLIIFFIGLFITIALYARRIRGAILFGILATLLLSLIAGKVKYIGIFGIPKESAFFKMDLARAFSYDMLAFILIFLFMDMFDTVGTLIGVAEQGGFIKENKIPRANRALVSDAIGTVVGACSGTSTVTSYIESCTGIAYGARTGLASVATAFLFLLALLFCPLVSMVAKYPPITAPALVIVGAMMVQNVFKIKWDDFSEAIPAFLIMLGIPLSFSIADGLAMGFIAYPIVKLLSGKGRETHWLMYILAAIFILRYTVIKI